MWISIWNFIRDNFPTLVDSASALGILVLTGFLWWIEHQRSAWSRKPIISIDTTVDVKDDLKIVGEIKVGNIGEGQALDCRVDWRPNDVPFDQGFKSLLVLRSFPATFSLDRGQSQVGAIDFDLATLAFAKSPHVKLIIAKDHLGQDKKVGVVRLVGRLTLKFEDRSAKSGSAKFNILYEGYNQNYLPEQQYRVVVSRVK